MTPKAKINIGFIAASVIIFSAWEIVRITTFLASKDSSDIYDKTWSFQLIVACIFHLPAFIFFITLILFIIKFMMSDNSEPKSK